ncbi:hypothetical protein [Erwinia sp. 9145]|uniref:hypothetical protein n=1 Tax=Erwinia sp. 9145 TaxID=1500895 RepID=UPI000557FC2B|nr:hypothetical protein [Erwinia sp. 9145]
MEKYYVSGVISDADGNCEMCADDVAQFWTVYERDSEGVSRAVFDCHDRLSAESAMTHLKAMDALKQQVNALTVECGLMRKLLPDYVSVPATDAAIRELQAQGVDISVNELKDLATRSEPVSSEYFHAAALYLMTVANQLRNEGGV